MKSFEFYKDNMRALYQDALAAKIHNETLIKENTLLKAENKRLHRIVNAVRAEAPILLKNNKDLL